MYLGVGATIEAKLGEVISSANVDVMTVAIDTANVISVKTNQQLDGTSFRTIVDANTGFVLGDVRADSFPHALEYRS